MAQVPDEKAREEIFKVHTQKMSTSKDVSVKKLAATTSGYTGSDIESICREAGMLTLRKDITSKEVKMSAFDEALKKVVPSITEQDIKTYQEIESTYLRTARGAAIRDAQQYMG
jgi:transitional endoplasmic reticulum ATPase